MEEGFYLAQPTAGKGDIASYCRCGCRQLIIVLGSGATHALGGMSGCYE